MGTYADTIAGLLLGTALGDAIGLPFEGISKQRQSRLAPDLDGHRFLFGRGMISDDTEHACMTLQSVLDADGDPSRFQRALAWRLRWWFLALPAGVGLATLRASLKLWAGVPPDRSGVYSAGNGPAMRAPVLGVMCAHDLRTWIRASTCMTHRDPMAEEGALAVAVAAHLAEEAKEEPLTPATFLAKVVPQLEGDAGDELAGRLKAMSDSVSRGESTEAFAEAQGLSRGVTGYMYHTVPVALHAWLSHQGDFREAVLATIRCGGDTDSTAAITGALAGAQCGIEGLPQDWLAGLLEWPRSHRWMRALSVSATQVKKGERCSSLRRISVPGVVGRNVFFLLVVLMHGFRRLLPPY